MRLAHMFLRLALGDMAGHFQIETERGEVMAEQVVQFARDAGALVDACAFGQQRAGGAQLGVEPALFFARIGLLTRHQAGDEDEHRKAAVQQRLHQRGKQGEVRAQVVEHRQHRQLTQHQPQHAHAQRQQPRDHPAATIIRMLPSPVPLR